MKNEGLAALLMVILGIIGMYCTFYVLGEMRYLGMI
jgi:hypothetical protein